MGTRRTPHLLPVDTGGPITYLVRGGAVLARDPDGVERFLATRIVDVFPLGGALYAVGANTGRRTRPLRVATGAAVEAQLRGSELQHVRFDDVSADAVGSLGGDLVRMSAADGRLTTLERATRPAPAVEPAPGPAPR